jgi:hypothetical protein
VTSLKKPKSLAFWKPKAGCITSFLSAVHQGAKCEWFRKMTSEPKAVVLVSRAQGPWCLWFTAGLFTGLLSLVMFGVLHRWGLCSFIRERNERERNVLGCSESCFSSGGCSQQPQYGMYQNHLGYLSYEEPTSFAV